MSNADALDPRVVVTVLYAAIVRGLRRRQQRAIYNRWLAPARSVN